MTIKFDEKLMENYIKDFPSVFVGEDLIFFAQQFRFVDGTIADLIFKDCRGRLVLIEVQQNTLDKNHLYRSLEYRDLLKVEYPNVEIRVVLIANDIKDKHRSIVAIHDIELISISKEDFIRKIEQVDPTLSRYTEPKYPVKERKSYKSFEDIIESKLETIHEYILNDAYFLVIYDSICNGGIYSNYRTGRKSSNWKPYLVKTYEKCLYGHAGINKYEECIDEGQEGLTESDLNCRSFIGNGGKPLDPLFVDIEKTISRLDKNGSIIESGKLIFRCFFLDEKNATGIYLESRLLKLRITVPKEFDKLISAKEFVKLILPKVKEKLCHKFTT